MRVRVGRGDRRVLWSALVSVLVVLVVGVAPPSSSPVGASAPLGQVTIVARGISVPFGIAAGPDGNLWFTNYGNDSIGRITPAGVVSTYTGAGISHPVGIAAGPDGNVWFTTLVSNSIGWVGAGVSGSCEGFVGVTPTRLLDTRSGPVPSGYPVGARLAGPGEIILDVTGVGPVPVDAKAVVLNVTSTQASSASGFVTVYPDGVARPTASNLNLNPGQNLPNLVTVKAGASGKVRLYTNTGATHLIADVVGYYR